MAKRCEDDENFGTCVCIGMFQFLFIMIWSVNKLLNDIIDTCVSPNVKDSSVFEQNETIAIVFDWLGKNYSQ